MPSIFDKPSDTAQLKSVLNAKANLFHNNLNVDFLPKIVLDIVIEDDLCEKACEVISKAAYTGKIGDGKIFISNIEEAIRIRTSETGSEAI